MFTEEVFEHTIRRAKPLDYLWTDFAPLPSTQPAILVKVRRFFRSCYYESPDDGQRHELDDTMYHDEVEAAQLRPPKQYRRSLEPLRRAILSLLSPFLARFGVPQADREKMARGAARTWVKRGAVLLTVDVVKTEVYEIGELLAVPAATEGGWMVEDDGDGLFPGVKTARVRGGECPICLVEIPAGSTAATMPCSHEYHGECIVKWLVKTPSCPMCRFSLLPSPPPSP